MFQPVVPLSGLTGWVFLQNTLDSQTAAFNRSPQITRDTDYFEAEIGKITSAEDLVSDRRLLRVTLGAFGLGDDIENRFLIRSVLESDTNANDALANRLADDRYAALADAFGFGSIAGPRTQDPLFGRQITEQYRTRSFEVAVGDQNEALRLALNADRELVDLAAGSESEDTKWFQILGTPPLRSVFETALGLPEGFAQLDIDKQREIFKDKASSNLGIDNLSDLADEAVREDFMRNYLLRDQIRDINFQSSTSIALSLLQSAPAQF
ncbi:MAG: DUF1217 domain-containing protein [Pseudomonadota bacterium]